MSCGPDMCKSGRNLLDCSLNERRVKSATWLILPVVIYYRLKCFSEVLNWLAWRFILPRWWKDNQAVALRGSKILNKVSLGAPAEGSLLINTLASAKRISIITSGCFGRERLV